MSTDSRTEAVTAIADALCAREWQFKSVPVGEDGMHRVHLPAEDIARLAIDCLAELGWTPPARS